MFNKKCLVSRRVHQWLVYSLNLNNNKLSKISELKFSEIESYLLAYINENLKVNRYKKRIEAYVAICYKFSELRVLDRYTEASMDIIAQTSINTLDCWLLRRQIVSFNRIEQLINSTSFKLAVDKKSNTTIKLNSKSSEKSNFVRYCNTFNSNKKCSSDCKYAHICKLCWTKSKEMAYHQPKDCIKNA